MSKRPTISVVVPLYNEEENVPHLICAVSDALKGHSYELVLVDDGSSDTTIQAVEKAADKQTVLVKLATNFGQTSAIAAGIDNAHGDYIATLDGDLQNDPADIPAMLEKLKSEKLDVVMGIRQKRQDGMFLRKIPSKLANKLIRRMTGVQASDYGCTLKIFRRQIAKQLDLYGELHRFIPILSVIKGAKIAEMPVRHHARRFGSSKYGLNRTLKVMSDLLLMLFFMRYRQRPMHLFGSIGIGMFGLGGLIAFYLFVEKLFGHDIGQRPLFYVGILLLIMSVQFVTAGFLAELIMRTYFESQQKKPYIIAHIEHFGDTPAVD